MYDGDRKLSTAYELIKAFQETINNSMEGDHPLADEVESWLHSYEAQTGMFAFPETEQI